MDRTEEARAREVLARELRKLGANSGADLVESGFKADRGHQAVIAAMLAFAQEARPAPRAPGGGS